MAKWSLSLPLLLCAAGSAFAEPAEVLTLQRVIELATDATAPVRVARTRVDEARGILTGAGLRFSENPAIEALVGPRWAGGRSTDTEIALSLPIELGGKRGKRIRVAEAAIASANLGVGDARRRAGGAAVVAFYRVLHAQQGRDVALGRKALADEFLAAATERQRAGDVALFEVHLAESEVARADSDVAAARRDIARARSQLAGALGRRSSRGFTVEGELSDRSLLATVGQARPADRADVRVAGAELAVANAEVSLADAERYPALAFRLSYAREEDADILLGGIALTLPLFQRAQGPRKEARARRDRAQIELEAATATAASELEGARAAYREAVEAVRLLEERALPRTSENAALAAESYRAGKIDLAALLIIRRDALEVRRELLDQSLEAALAGVDLWVAAGAPIPTRRQP